MIRLQIVAQLRVFIISALAAVEEVQMCVAPKIRTCTLFYISKAFLQLSLSVALIFIN